MALLELACKSGWPRIHRDPLASVSARARIKGMGHHPWPGK